MTATHTPSIHRVAVTGSGVVTAHGLGWRVNADAVRDGCSALSGVDLFPVSAQRVQTAGVIRTLTPLPPHQLTAREASRMERGGHMLLHSLHEALDGLPRPALGDAPIWLGTSAAAMTHGEAYYRQALARPLQRRGQLTRAAAYLAPHQATTACRAMGLSGSLSIISNACASGANAIGEAFMAVRSGRTQAAISGGYDALCQLVFAGFDSLKALSTSLPRPFDAARDGLALGEGAGILILEEWHAAHARGATILAEVTGYGMATDLHHLTQPDPTGKAAAASMTAACHMAQCTPADIHYLNAHGTGTPHNDVAEAHAITQWAGAAAAHIPVSSTKGGMGHLLGGAGAVEAAICLMVLREGFLPPSLNVRTPDPACRFDLITAPRSAQPQHVLTNSFGFGGSNASLILRRV